MTIEIDEIERIIPHRYPFLFIDRIIEIEDGKTRRRDQERDGERMVLRGSLSGP